MKSCLTNGFGKSGMGCVSDGFSPNKSVSVGTGISLMGYTGLPVALLSRNIKPDLVACANASISLPSFLIVTNTGAVGKSLSQRS